MVNRWFQILELVCKNSTATTRWQILILREAAHLQAVAPQRAIRLTLQQVCSSIERLTWCFLILFRFHLRALIGRMAPPAHSAPETVTRTRCTYFSGSGVTWI